MALKVPSLFIRQWLADLRRRKKEIGLLFSFPTFFSLDIFLFPYSSCLLPPFDFIFLSIPLHFLDFPVSVSVLF
jgi:hypothetical protein